MHGPSTQDKSFQRPHSKRKSYSILPYYTLLYINCYIWCSYYKTFMLYCGLSIDFQNLILPMTPAYYYYTVLLPRGGSSLLAHLRADIWVHLSTYLAMNSDWCEHWHVTQGKLVLKDFNIQELAGNSFIGVDKTFVAQVSNGVLDIHLFYAGKGTCCTSDGRWSYGPLISAISAKNVLNRENLESSLISASRF